MTALERAIARPDPVADFGARSPMHGLDRRAVGFADVLAQSVSAVAPSAAATTVVLLVAGISPAVTVPAILVAAVLSLLIARTVSQFARRFAATGSLYTYTARGLGPGAGLAAGAAILVGYGAIAIFALLGGAYYTTFLLASIWPGFGSAAATAGVLVIEALLVVAVLVSGIRLSARVALVVEGVSVAIIVALLIVLLVRIGPVDPAVLVSLDGMSLPALAAASVVAVTAFVGFESAATLGAEARSPLRSIPRAMVWTVVLAGGLYVLAAVTQVAGFAVLGAPIAASASPVNELAAAFGLAGWGIVADVGIAASFLACAIGSMTAFTRVLFTMGRDGVLPPVVGRTHRRFGTPIVAIAVSMPIVALVPLAWTLLGVEIRDAMHLTIGLGAAGYIVSYILVCVAVPVFLRRIGELTVGGALASLVSAASLAAALVCFFVSDAAAGGVAVWASAVLGVVAAVVIATRLRRGPASLAGMGTYDEPIAADVLGGVARGSAAQGSADAP